MADLTALRRDAQGRFYESNYARGRVLYALVAARRPSAILEFGTGRGYGALCMAWAMADHDIPGRIWTIDLVGHRTPFEWTLRDSGGPRVERWSRQALWSRCFPAEWIRRVLPLEGRSERVMARWADQGRPAVDLAFVDGGHDLETARHDLLAAIGVGSDRLGLLADDYLERPGIGVVSAFRELFGDPVPVAVVHTTWGDLDGGPEAGMAFLDLGSRPQDLARLRERWRQRRRWLPRPWKPR